MAENQTPSIILCPYCGHIQQLTDQKCEACGGFFDRLSLKATQVAMGPWFIHNAKKPFKPGCSYDVIKKQAAAGRIHSRTIMRGPTTRQFWSFAKNVPGVAHLIGYCHNCGLHVTPTEPKCSKCNAPFKDVTLRNEMGLLYPTTQEAAKAQEQLEKEAHHANNPLARPAAASAPHAAPAAHAPEHAAKGSPGDDLLDEVIGRVEKQTGGKAAPRPVSAAPAASAGSAKHAAPTGSPAAPVPANPGLDLGDTDDDETTPTPALPRAKSNTLAVVLLIIGLICVLAIQVAIWVNMDKGNSTAENPAPGSAASEIGSQLGGGLPPPPTGPRPTANPDRSSPPDIKPKPADGSSTPPPAVPSSQPPKATGSAAPTPAAPAPDKKPESFQDRFKEALKLEDQKKFKESLAILEDLQKKTPLKEIPKEMYDAMRRIQSKAAQQSSAPLFEAP
jgi:hypothetical protein